MIDDKKLSPLTRIAAKHGSVISSKMASDPSSMLAEEMWKLGALLSKEAGLKKFLLESGKSIIKLPGHQFKKLFLPEYAETFKQLKSKRSFFKSLGHKGGIVGYSRGQLGDLAGEMSKAKRTTAKQFSKGLSAGYSPEEIQYQILGNVRQRAPGQASRIATIQRLGERNIRRGKPGWNRNRIMAEIEKERSVAGHMNLLKKPEDPTNTLLGISGNIQQFYKKHPVATGLAGLYAAKRILD